MKEEGRSLLEEIENHLGNKLMWVILGYQSSKDILSMNTFEVLRYIGEIESGRFQDIALDQNRRHEYQDYQNHLIRYFHNFLAGAKTVVEHTRNLMRSDLITEDHRKEYQDQVENIFSDGLSKFIGDFRNYTLHFGVPKISHVFSLLNEKWEVALDLKDHADWNGWTARSREFIERHPNQIRLSWLIGTYQQKAISLHEWLVNSFPRHYGDVFSDFDRLRGRWHETQQREQGDAGKANSVPS